MSIMFASANPEIFAHFCIGWSTLCPDPSCFDPREAAKYIDSLELLDFFEANGIEFSAAHDWGVAVHSVLCGDPELAHIMLADLEAGFCEGYAMHALRCLIRQHC